MSKQQAKIKDILERLYASYNHRHLIKPDPLQFVYRYSRPADREIAGLLSAVLAYGRVEQIEKSVSKLLALFGNSPYDFVMSFEKKHQMKLKDFKHRFTTGQSISDLLKLLKNILKRFNTIENFFVQGYHSSDKNIIPALSQFCNSLLDIHTKSNNGQVSKGLSYLLPRPEAGSACKRLNLFLRWMVRDDDVDTGLWKVIDKAKLIVPVDVHMGRLCRILGFYNRKTVSLSAAVEITNSFAEIEPNDPVKYDFSLSRVGIIENCTSRYNGKCTNCELSSLCK
ncbi:TIGR02757 family protein [Planctomycetota bacterium]